MGSTVIVHGSQVIGQEDSYSLLGLDTLDTHTGHDGCKWHREHYTTIGRMMRIYGYVPSIPNTDFSPFLVYCLLVKKNEYNLRYYFAIESLRQSAENWHILTLWGFPLVGLFPRVNGGTHRARCMHLAVSFKAARWNDLLVRGTLHPSQFPASEAGRARLRHSNLPLILRCIRGHSVSRWILQISPSHGRLTVLKPWW